MKKVLVLCTGNSCRSILGEALINKYLDGIKAYSAGTKPAGKINENAKKILIAEGAWSDSYHSKNLDEVIDIDFDLVVTVCALQKRVARFSQSLLRKFILVLKIQMEKNMRNLKSWLKK